MKPRLVTGRNNQGAAYSSREIRKVHQGICCRKKTRTFKYHHAFAPEHGYPGGDFNGHFLIDGIFKIKIKIIRKIRQCVRDLRRRGTGVTGTQPETGLNSPPGRRFIPQDMDFRPCLSAS